MVKNPIIGRKVRDRISGFEGVVTGRWERLNGEPSVELSPQRLSDEGLFIEPVWFPEAQIVVIEDED